MRDAAGKVPNINSSTDSALSGRVCDGVPRPAGHSAAVIGDTGVQFSARLIFTFVPDNDLLFVWPAASIIPLCWPTQHNNPQHHTFTLTIQIAKKLNKTLFRDICAGPCCSFDQLAACVSAASSAGEGSAVGATWGGHAAVTTQQGLHSSSLCVSADSKPFIT